jgi:hypothetical protein
MKKVVVPVVAEYVADILEDVRTGTRTTLVLILFTIKDTNVESNCVIL